VTDTARLAPGYADNGFLVIRQALTKAETESYRACVDEWLGNRAPTGDSYEAILYQAHLPWQRGGPLADLTRHARLAAIARHISGMAALRVFLDQVIVKPPGGAPTVPHQDAPFLSFDDHRSLNCWVALDDVTAANGALSYYRGSHRLGPLPRSHLDEGDTLERLVPALKEFPVDLVEMRAGDVAFHNCFTVHRGSANETAEPRRAFSIQYMAADARYNGYEHEFLSPYQPVVGQPLAFPCFAVPGHEPLPSCQVAAVR
jgi:phytanoyl-CoA hydroxylase